MSNSTALSTAERLVKEYQSTADPYKGQVLDSLVLVASKTKANVERALAVFIDICQKKVVEVMSSYKCWWEVVDIFVELK